MRAAIIYFLLPIFLVSYLESTSHTISIVGTGYVGLVTGSCLASFGHKVIFVDIDAVKINNLKRQIIPFYEAGLSELFTSLIQKNIIAFTTNLIEAVKQSEIIFITVGTPLTKEGVTDLSAIEKIIDEVGRNLQDYKLIVMKSTVPIGTANTIIKTLTENFDLKLNENFNIVSYPEFLREGTAIYDFLNPDRLIIGIDSDKSLNVITELLNPLIQKDIPLVVTNNITAEMIKYASNTYLGLKIGFINELAHLAQATKANIKEIAYGMGLDKRIGLSFLNAGPGFGGSCLPKDIKELINTASKLGIDLSIAKALLDSNERQQQEPFKKLNRLLMNELKGKSVAILGLSFKAETDDIRFSPALKTIEALLSHRVHIKAYDPVAMENMKKIFPSLEYCATLDEVVENTDALILLTEWKEFKEMNLEKIAKKMRSKIIVDARNILNTSELDREGFIWENIGASAQGIK